MRILQLSTSDFGGGAERAARDLHEGLLEAGCSSDLLVGRQRGGDRPGVEPLYDRERWTSRAWSRTRQYAETATGRQAFFSKAFPRWWRAREKNWDIVVCHNLHGIYFDFDFLPEMAQAQPVVMVLHDLWNLTGHCAYPMECPRFQTGCGACPDLKRVPAVWHDRTAAEWSRKMNAIRGASPVLVAVSRWVDQQIAKSALAALPRTTIPYGIPDAPAGAATRHTIRERLGWPPNKKVYLYVSSGGLTGTGYKDPETLIAAARELQKTKRTADKLIVTVGGRRVIDASLSTLVQQHGHVAGGLENFYRAADYFVYPTRIETVGLVLVEAARAGLPAITVAAGGCPEVVEHGKTGLVVQPGDPVQLAQAMCDIESLDAVALGARARQRYERLFTRTRMIQDYLHLFHRLHHQAGPGIATGLAAGCQG